jgi:hypothetical protein
MPVIFLNQNEQALMPIPDFQTTMLPLLRFCGDEKEHSLRTTLYRKEIKLSKLYLRDPDFGLEIDNNQYLTN